MKKALSLFLLPVACVFLVSAARAPGSPSSRWAEGAGGSVLVDPDSMKTETERIFGLFDHGTHKKALQRNHLGCVACHPVGAPPPSSAAPGATAQGSMRIAPPPGACHYCHNPPDGAPPDGPTRCTACHQTIALPATHGAGWTENHGQDARLSASECEDCHANRFCLDCHARKETVRFKVHDRTWSTVHGIASRADPASCSTCHLQADCVQCHQGGRGSP